MDLKDIDKTKCCKTHTEEKEETGECCQINGQKETKQATYKNEVNKESNGP